MKTKLIPTALLIAALGFSAASTAQSYCTPPGFKSMGGVGEPFTYISKVQLGSLTNTSGMPSGVGDDNGYLYYDNVTVPQLTKGVPYELKISANDNLGMGMGVVVWIDWNNDGTFHKDNEKVAEWVGPGNHGQTILVPASTPNGKVRMRVYCDMPPDQGHIAPEPCGYLNYPTHVIGQHGEVEDYDIHIGSTVGISSLQRATDIKLYPNPANNTLHVDNLSENNMSYKMMNIFGSVVNQGMLKNTNSTIDVSNLATGKYIMMLEGESTYSHMPVFISR